MLIILNRSSLVSFYAQALFIDCVWLDWLIPAEVKKPFQYASKNEVLSSGSGLGPVPIPTITTLVFSPEGNFTPTLLAAFTPAEFASTVDLEFSA
jgi:hypothetical protein